MALPAAGVQSRSVAPPAPLPEPRAPRAASPSSGVRRPERIEAAGARSPDGRLNPSHRVARSVALHRAKLHPCRRSATAAGPSRIAVEQGVEHQPVVFGAVFQDWNLPLPDGLSSYALQAVRQQLSAAQRLSLIGQSEAQQLLHRLKPAALAAVERSRGVSMEEAGACAPWLDLAGIRHRELSG